MSKQSLEDHKDLLQISKCIFETGEYLPTTANEAEWLCSFGFELKGSAIVLPDGIERLDQEFIEQSLMDAGTMSNLRSIQVKHCVESTNKELLHAIDEDDISGTVVLTEMQVAGRGRFGRKWYSPVGKNLAMSLGTRISRELEDIGAVSLVVGVAVASAIQEIGIDAVALKWPNDILLHERKAGGILVESLRAKTPIDIVVGIGLNIGGCSSTEKMVDRPIADLLDYCVLPVRNALAVSIIRKVYDSIFKFEQVGFQAFHETWHALDALKDQFVKLSNNSEHISGVARGVRESGELCIELHDGKMHYVNAGEVSLD